MLERIIIQKVTHVSVTELDHLVDESAASGYHFVTKLVEEYKSGVNRFSKPGEALFAAVDPKTGQIVGVGGLNQDPYTNLPEVGRVRHVYVAANYRQLGIGRMLLTQILSAADGHFRLLTLRTSNPAADRLYQQIGFLKDDRIAHATHYFVLAP